MKRRNAILAATIACGLAIFRHPVWAAIISITGMNGNPGAPWGGHGESGESSSVIATNGNDNFNHATAIAGSGGEGDLAGPWTTVASSIGGASFTGPGYVAALGGSPQITEIRDIVNIGEEPRRFMRARVVKP